MARMPQIPQPELSGRPGGNIGGRAEAPDIKAVTEPFESGAKLLGEVGNDFERLQKQRDDAQQKLQKAVDGVTATRMAGDHSEKARNLLDSLQVQYADTPEKVPEEYRRQLSELTDSEIKAAPNQGVALDIAQKYATIDNQHVASSHSWMVLRQAQKAKSDLAALASSHVRAAQAQTTLPGLQAAINGALSSLDPHIKNLHSDPDLAREKLSHDMAAGWVEANSPNNPKGVAIALEQGKGPLAQHLSADERAKYAKRAESDFHGYGEHQRFQVMKEASDHGAKAYELFLKGDLDSRNVFQMKDALEKKQSAIERNPNLSGDEKKTQNEIVSKQLKTLRYLDEAARKPGRFDPAFDQAKQTKLLGDFFALGKPGDKTAKDLLKVVQLRHDLAEAQANRWISDARAQTMNKALTQMTGKSLAAESKNTGWPVSFMGFGGRSPQQAGNVVLNSYFKSDNLAFGKLTPEQQNDARTNYLEQLVDAQENGRNIDSKAAEQMAFESLKYVSGRAKHPVTVAAGGR